MFTKLVDTEVEVIKSQKGCGMKKLTFILYIIVFSSPAFSEGILYYGMGNSQASTTTKNGEAPWSLGYLGLKDQGTSIGVELSGEGTVLDSTYRQNQAAKQASSFNLLLGRNMSKSDSLRVDGAILFGFREKTKDCPDSYLGYACYANADPDTDYDFNYGAMLMFSVNKLALGLRVSGESSQMLLGFKF